MRVRAANQREMATQRSSPTSGKGRKDPPGWNRDYAELENETAALLSSIRGKPSGSSVTQVAPVMSVRTRKRDASPRRRKGKRPAPQQPGVPPTSASDSGIYGENSVQASQQHSNSFAGLILRETEDSLAGITDDILGSTGSFAANSLQRTRRVSVKKKRRALSKSKSRRQSEDSVRQRLNHNPLASKTRGMGRSRTSAEESHEVDDGDFQGGGSSHSSSSTPREEVEPDGSEEGSVADKRREEEEAERVAELERVRQEEKKLRDLSFREEETRVRKGVDGFVPHPVTKVAPARVELETEKLRLQNIEQSIAQREMGREMALAQRDQRLDEMTAAEEIQRVFRGFLGRRKARVKRKEQDLGYSHAMLPPLHPAMGSPKKFPRNKLPIETPSDADDFGYLRPASDSLGKRLPKIIDRPQSAGSIATSRSSTSSSSSTDLDVDDVAPAEITPRLFLPDGSPDVKLRETVRNALKVSRFDSVSTLLASGPMARRIKNAAKGVGGIRGGKKGHVAYTPGVKGAAKSVDGGQPLVSIMVDRDGKPKSKGVKKAKAAMHDGPPAMFEVEHPGFDAADPTGENKARQEALDDIAPKTATGKKKTRQVCFACWSAGDDMVKRCEMHNRELDELEAAGKDPDESILMCSCWDVNALRRRYRAEELQEVFAKAVSSLRWDLNRKQFVTVVECRHPIYRMLNAFILLLNKRKTRIDHARAWFRSIIEEVRNGKVKSFSEEQANKSKMLKLKNSLLNFAWVQRAAKEVYRQHPRPPTTEMEMSGLVGAAELRHTIKFGILIIAPPTPVPVILYKMRYYDLPAAVYCRVPKPSHVFSPYEGEESKGKGFLENRFMPEKDPKSWLEQLSRTWSEHAVDKAIEEVYQSAPPVERYRTKYPRAVTIKYANFLRKQAKKNLAMGGLPAIAILNQKVSTLIPPQYGNFVVIDRRSIAPKLRENVSSDFPTLQPWDPPPPCSCRALVSALDDRVVPTITVSTCAYGAPKPLKKAVTLEDAESIGGVQDEDGDAEEEEEEEVDREALDDGDLGLQSMDNWTLCIRLYNGENRPEQTGESAYTGFRTTSRTVGLPQDPVTSASGFTPSVDVAIPNRAGNHGTVCSQADINYPFCIPSTRPNTMYDFYELLVNDKCSSNQACCFTVLGKQDPGDFGIKNNMKGDLGLLHTKVYRSFGFIQTSNIEEFKTPEGVSYWYDPRTGETVWEKPLDEESDDEGEYEPLERGDDEPVEPRYSEKHMRKHLLANYEKGEDSDSMKEMKELSKISIGSLKELPGPQVAKGLMPIGMGMPTPPSSSRGKQGDDALIHRTDPSGQFKTHSRVKGTPRGEGGQDLPQSTSAAIGGKVPPVPTLPVPTPTPAPVEGPTPRTLSMPQEEGPSVQPHSLQSFAPKPHAQEQVAQTPAEQQQNMLEFFANALQNVFPMVQQQQQNGQSNPEEMLRLGLGLGLGIALRSSQNGGNMTIVNEPKQQQTESSAQRSADSLNISQSMPKQHKKAAPELSMVPKVRVEPNKMRRVLPKATPSPDELEEIERMAPPQDVIVQEYSTHAAATEMVTFKPVGHKETNPVKRSAVSLPEGFIASVFESHTGKQHVDYLPATSNINVPREVGVVKPNPIAGVWEKKGFDPWSDGKDPYSTCFVPSLNFDEDDVAKKPEGDMVDEEGLSKMQLELKQKNKEEQDIKFIFSCARHGKFREIEEAFDQPDWTVDINAQDATGATLLQTACQNGNKRIVKFCMRRGADINKTNLAGNTPLHYCFAYGFESLGEYLMEKGADDSIQNADGLTCYEGLNMDSVEQI